MSICPFAVWRPMPWQATLPARKKVALSIAHTNGGGTDKGSLYGWFSRKANTDHECAHFQVMASGTLEQYVDTDRQAYAQWSGNAYGVSYETQDDGNPGTPWTPAQLATIIRLNQWLGVPAQVATEGGPGLGWHQEFADWNRSGHNCPGPVRLGQLRNVVIPALARPPLTSNVQEDDMQPILIQARGGSSQAVTADFVTKRVFTTPADAAATQAQLADKTVHILDPALYNAIRSV